MGDALLHVLARSLHLLLTFNANTHLLEIGLGVNLIRQKRSLSVIGSSIPHVHQRLLHLRGRHTVQLLHFRNLLLHVKPEAIHGQRRQEEGIVVTDHVVLVQLPNTPICPKVHAKRE